MWVYRINWRNCRKVNNAFKERLKKKREKEKNKEIEESFNNYKKNKSKKSKVIDFSKYRKVWYN